MSKIERVVPAAGRFGSTPGGGGRPSLSSKVVAAVRGRRRVERRRLQEGRVLRLRRRGAAGREVPEHAEAAANHRLAISGQIVGEAEPRPEVALRIGLQLAANLDAVDHRVVRGDHERASRLVEVRLPVVDSRSTADTRPTAARDSSSGGWSGDSHPARRGRTQAAFRCRCCASNRSRFFAFTRPSMKLATSNPVALFTVHPAGWPAQFDVMLLLKLKLPTIVSALRISRDRSVMLPPALHRVLALDPRHVVEDLEVVLVRDERLVAVGAQIADVLERQLRHRRGRIVQIDVQADRPRWRDWSGSRSAS